MATQLFGRSVANLIIPLKDYRKKLKGLTSLKHIRDETSLQFFQENIPVDFRDPLPFRRLPAKPHQSMRLSGLGYPVIRQECRTSLQPFKEY
ncbi:hypothetical protein AB3M94_02500 [Peribacillus frigoritolerans]